MHVLLARGLGRTSLSLAGLARSLRKAGHATESFRYVAAIESSGSISARLQSRLRIIAALGQPYAVLGHSLGGLLLRHAITELERPPFHLIMLGTPNRPPRLAQRVNRVWPFRLATGEPGRRLADPEFFRALPIPVIPYTIIAGTGGPRGRFSPFGSEPNDWLVAVSETLIMGTDRPLQFPVSHTFMMLSGAVRAEVRRILGEAPAIGSRGATR
jgi:hypothetical protein